MNRLGKLFAARTVVATVVLVFAALVAAGCSGSGDVKDGAGDDGTDRDAAPATRPPRRTDVWKPQPGTTFQYQLNGRIDTSVDADAFILDLFDTSDELVDELHRKGKVVICEFSAGAWERDRPDAEQFPPEVLGGEIAGPDVRWLDVARFELLVPVILPRMDQAVNKMCDAVLPIDVDGVEADTGFDITEEEQLRWNRLLAQEAGFRNLSVGLRNSVRLLEDLAPAFDFAVNEECVQLDECDLYESFTGNDKATFVVEYTGDMAKMCDVVRPFRLTLIKKPEDLSAPRETCPA
jgi:hypothetical protein